MKITVKVFEQTSFRLYKKVLHASSIPANIVKNIGKLDEIEKCWKN